LKIERGMEMNKLIESIKTIEKHIKKEMGIINVSYNMNPEQMEVHIFYKAYKEIISDLNINPLYIRVDTTTHDDRYRLIAEKDGIIFFTLVKEEVYYDQFEQWLELPFTDEELETESNVTTYERKLKESGMKQHDFM